jgi:hypothetical protein
MKLTFFRTAVLNIDFEVEFVGLKAHLHAQVQRQNDSEQ